MSNYEQIIKKKGKDPKFYLPLIKVLKKKNKPLSIKEMARLLKITYGAAKPRLHKLEKWGLIKRMKRGFYCLPNMFPNYSKVSKPKGELFFINGCIRVMPQSNGVWIHIYNSKFGEKNHGKYCVIELSEKKEFIIRKSNEYRGNKLHFLLSKSVGVSISRDNIPKKILSNLSTKTTPIKIGIYPQEWDTSVQDLFSTESSEDGELASKLNKIGDVEKLSKFDNLKADIIFFYKNKRVPIEITTSKPSETSKQPQHRKSSIKASQILMRFYYSIKWNFLHNVPTILILHRNWIKYKWINEEEKFMKNFNCFLIFTDFKGDWAHKSTLEIKRLTESSLFNKTTLLRSS